MKLNNIQIKNAKPQDKPYHLMDGDNLSLLVTPQGGKVWRLAYRHNNKRRQIALGIPDFITPEHEAGFIRLNTTLCPKYPDDVQRGGVLMSLYSCL